MIEIGFGTDAGYVPHLAATIRSIRDTSGDAPIRVHIAHGGLDPALMARVEAVAPDFLFAWHEVPDSAIRNLSALGRWPKSAFYRLALPDLLPSVDRILYLDCDLILCRSVADLWAQALTAPLAAVEDGFTDPAAFAREWDLPALAAPGYFNSGVMILDLKALRRSRRFDQVLDILARDGARCPYIDQDAINVAFWGEIQRLPVAWNVQRNMLLDAPWKPGRRAESPVGRQPFVVHYTTEQKPWKASAYHPYAWLYWSALRRTDFYGQVVRESRVGPLKQLRLYARWLKAAAAFEPWPADQPSAGRLPAPGLLIDA